MTTNTLATWRRLVEERDSNGLAELLDDDVILLSPVSPSPLRGKQDVLVYLTGAFKAFFNSSFHYIREFPGSTVGILEFQSNVDGTAVNGVEIIKWNEHDKIVELTVMLRPLHAINKIHHDMAEKIKARRQ